MSSPDLSIRDLFTPGAILKRLALVGGIIVIASFWRSIHGAHYAPVSVHLHWPRLWLLAQAPLGIRLHIAAALVALAVGSVLLAGVKGTALHKRLGWTWVIALGATAVSSLFIPVLDPGRWSVIHLLSGWVLIALPLGVVAIRRGNVERHRRTMTGLFIGGLLVAGLFTFAPGRLMWNVFFG